MALFVTFVALLAGVAAARYTLLDVTADNPGVAHTIRRFDGLLDLPSCCKPESRESASDSKASSTS